MTLRCFFFEKKIICYWILQTIVSLLDFLLSSILFILHGRKGEVVPPVENRLLMKSATKLAEEIREGKLKSEAVVEAYIDRIIEVEPYINATTVRCFEDALNKAREVDTLVGSGNYDKEELSEKTPLLGVPFTVKCMFRVKGLPCTSASKLFVKEIAPEDAECVAAMKRAGAIVLSLTNMPEFALNFESSNKLYGATSNPYDTNRTCGGSSGGDAALIGAGASLLGLGNDLCGSLRIPAHFCGIFAHKSTTGLASNKGSVPPTRLPPFENTKEPDIGPFIHAGPMCRYAEDLVIAMRILCTNDQVKMTFGKKVDFKKMKICYLTDTKGYMSPSVETTIITNLKRAVSYFEQTYDVKAKEVHFPSLIDANRCVVTTILISTDATDTATCGRGLDFDVKLDFLKYFLGWSTLSFMAIVILNLCYFPIWFRRDLKSYFDALRQKWISEFDSLLNEDTVLFMPSFPTTAPYLSGTFFKSAGSFYSSIFNVIALPATQCPLGFDERGLPCGIQIVGRKNNDALTIACAVELEKAFGGWKSPGTI